MQTARRSSANSCLLLGEQQLASDYSAFYLRGWDYFLSDYADSDAGRAVLLAGAKVLRCGIEIARSRAVDIAEDPPR